MLLSLSQGLRKGVLAPPTYSIGQAVTKPDPHPLNEKGVRTLRPCLIYHNKNELSQ